MGQNLTNWAETTAHARVLDESLSVDIPDEQPGLSIYNGEFCQTPLNDNTRSWIEEVAPDSNDEDRRPSHGKVGQ